MVSILASIKQMHGIGNHDESFDAELTMHINGALMVMTQLGVGPSEGFSITSDAEKWSDFFQGRTDLGLVQNCVFLRTKLVFDPPTNSFLITSIERQIKEYDWRIEEKCNRPKPEV